MTLTLSVVKTFEDALMVTPILLIILRRTAFILWSRDQAIIHYSPDKTSELTCDRLNRHVVFFPRRIMR